MMSRLVFLLFCGYIALNLGNAQKLPRVKRQSLKVQINATDDTVCMRYLRPSQNTKLEGFVLGYGSNFFSNQYIPLPSEGKTYITELDAEPRYLVSVRPARISNNKKSCSGRTKTQKPLQLVVGTLTPTSVFLSWGILVNPQHDWTATSNCASDRFYTVRYREKGKDKKWVFQLCPVTETVVDNLKPNTIYEFGVKDNVEDSIWSKTFNHKTVLSSKYVTIINQIQQSLPAFKERKRGLNRHCPISFIFLKHLHKGISEHDVCQKMLQTPMLSISSLTWNVKNGNSHKRALFI
uniref:Fibronectin type-III domain-containing protein n=1 Tax=Buteo japonicus TaxID=224669 RepID=A0A8B9Z499_9AVES